MPWFDIAWSMCDPDVKKSTMYYPGDEEYPMHELEAKDHNRIKRRRRRVREVDKFWKQVDEDIAEIVRQWSQIDDGTRLRVCLNERDCLVEPEPRSIKTRRR
jgi:hypothetical protein